MAKNELVLGIDLGTSSVKVIALSAAEMGVAASGSAAFPTISQLPDQAEQDPGDWVTAVGEALEDLARALDAKRAGWRDHVGAIGVTGQLPTLVCSSARGPLGRAITWKDARADRDTLATIDSAQRRALYERTGMPIDGRYLGPMFRHHWAARRAEVESVLSAKDYLVFVLTGQRVTDPSTAAGYGAFELATGSFSQELCGIWQLPIGALPSVRPAHSPAGPLTPVGARLLGLRAGIPVTVGAADSVASAFAMTGLEEAIVSITTGSSTVILDSIREPRFDPTSRYLLTPHVEAGWLGREMDLLATGTGYRWLTELLGLRDGELDRRAADSPPGSRELTFAPYLAGGEQGALWNPDLRGALLGLTLRHTASDIARAFLEGVGFEIRRCVEVLAETGPVSGVVVAGHLAEHPTNLKMLADILHQPVQPFPATSPAALGAALGAMSLLTRMPPHRTGIAAALPPKVLPGRHSKTYEHLYPSYLMKSR